MTREEKIKQLQDKAADLLAWFDGKELRGNIKLLPGETVIDGKYFFEIQAGIIGCYHSNPYSKAFITAYLRLDNYKSIIENKS